MKKDHGVTIVELLIALGVVGIMLVVVASFFSFQSRTTVRVQGSNELAVRVRAVGEIVAKDLQLTGGQAVVVGGTPAYINAVRTICDPPVGPDNEPDGTNADCITVDGTSGDVELVYASSLWPDGERCRRVGFHYDAATNVLYRADVTCASTLPATWTFATEIASGITQFQLSFTCERTDSDGDGIPDTRLVVNDPQLCYDAGGYVRTGTVQIDGDSPRRNDLTNSLTLTTNMPNVRNPIDFSGTP